MTTYTPSEYVVGVAALALSQHWNDLHTNESMGKQRMLATAALAEVGPIIAAEAVAQFIARVLTDEAMDPAVAEIASHAAVTEGDAYEYAWNAVEAALAAARGETNDD